MTDAREALTALVADLDKTLRFIARDQVVDFDLVRIDPLDNHKLYYGSIDARALLADLKTVLEIP